MKPFILGIVGGLIAFISLALPWWTVTFASSFMGINEGQTSVSVYLFQAKTGLSGHSSSPPPSHVNLWFGWIALGLIIVGGLLGIVGGLRQRVKTIIVGAVLVLTSITVFAVGLQSELWKGPVDPWGFSVPRLFSSGIIHQDSLVSSVAYTAYLTYGFWVALVAAVIMFAASLEKVTQKPEKVMDLNHTESAHAI